MNMNTVPKEDFFYGWKIVGIGLLITMFLYTPIVTLMNIFLKQIAVDLNASRGQIMIGLAICQIVSMFCAPFLGSYLNKGNLKKSIVLAVLVHGLAFISFSFAYNTLTLYVLYGILGVTILTIFLLGLPLLVNNWFISKRGLALGIILTGSGFGGLILSPIASRIFTQFTDLDWRFTIQVLGVIGLAISLPLAMIFIKDKPSDINKTPYKIEEVSDSSNTTDINVERYKFDRTVFIYHAGALMLFMMAAANIVFITQPYLTDVGYTIDQAADIQALYVGSLIIGKISLGYILDKFGARIGGSLSIFLFILCVLCLLFITNKVLLVLFILFYMIGGSAPTILAPNSITDLYGRAEYSKNNGRLVIFTSLGGIIGVVMGNVLHDIFKSYDIAFMLTIIFFVLSIILLNIAYIVRNKKFPLTENIDKDVDSVVDSARYSQSSN